MKRCSLPLTAAAECDVIITERALFRWHPDSGFLLEEVARGWTLDAIRAATGMDYEVSDRVKLGAYGPIV